VPELNECEKKKLGADVELHEQLEKAIEDSFNETEKNNYHVAYIAKTRDLLQELIDLRNTHGLPNDGECLNCDGSKCI